MKRIALIAALLVGTMLLSGCVLQVTQEDIALESGRNNMFMLVSREKSGRVMVDKDTNVMYWMSYGGDSYGILTPLINSDGTPKIWEAR